MASTPEFLATKPASVAARIGLLAGAGCFAALLLCPAPDGLGAAAWRTAAVAVLMAIWWITEAIPIPATALLPLALFPILGISDMETAAAPYGNDLIFLFLGGFFLALAMERWGLHRRIALAIVTRVGTSPQRIVLGFMLATAFVSMWISNTATTAMMLPITLAVADLFRPRDARAPYPLGTCLMLGIAYAASIGGVSTLIGTPPNIVFAGAVQQILGVEIGFLEWMAVGTPLAAVLLPLAWLLLTRVLYRPEPLPRDAGEVIRAQRRALGPLSRGEWIVAIVFASTALAWVFRAPKTFGATTLPGLQSWIPALEDSTIAIAAGLVLFVAPIDLRRGEFVLSWDVARKLPWGVLLLFGGGFALADAMDHTGLAAWIGASISAIETVPPWVAFAAVAAMFVLLSEITSNVAIATMGMPVVAGAAAGLGVPPLELMATATLAASMGFMLPVATPPNAIVFGSGYITIGQMVRAGWWLDLISIAVLTAVALLLVPALA